MTVSQQEDCHHEPKMVHLCSTRSDLRLEVVFYRTTAGKEPVREWLKGLPKQDR